MPFIILPVSGPSRGDKHELYQSYRDAKETAEVKAKENPGTTYQIYATVASVFVPAPSPVWNEERYVPEQLK